ncbi:FecCD family ABC transporter permease [Corynebacterium renale]|uniref:Iron complex transport system permease protein n=1 Tax=Corynebacterium renale TaxID=1724 RepID=A0A2A9DQ60_9CORY|nr:iron ABC transporter permease [Corynebacterium renale]PFG28050.1 iron complex transport system permease protein [Corynebacterium renale]SQI21143.1 ABC-type transporter, permease component [Corynebacterium renale]
MVGLFLALIATLTINIGVGSVPVSAGETWNIISHHVFGTELTVESLKDTIVWDIRAPRAILGLFVGAGLSIAGAILQTLVRNMLADPYIIGINGGASTGAALAILFGAGAAFGDYALQGSAFLGALAASFLLYAVARSQGRLTSIRLLMAGVAIGYALSAVTSFLIFASDDAEGSRSVMFWLLGSLGLAKWDGALLVCVITVLVCLAIAIVWGRNLDALGIGDETALTAGINPERFRALMLVLSCLLVGALVAMAGSISFVGLVIPHLARRAVGGSHRTMLPVAALLGAVLLMWADVGARTLLAPRELSIGIITALVGAPFLLILVRKMRATG